MDKQSKSGVIRPSYYDIAKAIARHKNLKIAPSGDQALYILGLSDQVPASFVYFTDGITKSFPIKGGKEIFFSHIEPRKIAFSNETAMLITFALNEIGADNVTAEQEKTIVALLQNVKKKSVLADSLLMPDWIRCIVEGAYKE